MEYLELVLCRDVYHCTPSELAAEDWRTIEAHLEVMAAEAQVRDMTSGNRGTRRTRGRLSKPPTPQPGKPEGDATA